MKLKKPKPLGKPKKIKDLSEEEIIERSRVYLRRMSIDPLVETHPLEKLGYWEVESGSIGHPGQRHKLITVHGRFGDIISYAVQLERFYGNGLRDNNKKVGSSVLYDGRIKVAKIKHLKSSPLFSKLASYPK